MNQHLHGYTLRLGHAHAGLLDLRLTLDDLVMRQQANPEPPILVIPRLRLKAEWRYLLTGRMVGEVLFERPQIHYDWPQVSREELTDLTPGRRGWQKALESVYPLKLNRFEVRDGALAAWQVYCDNKPVYEIMARNRVDDEYIANWFRYEPVSLPAPKPKSSNRVLARSKAARG